MKRGFVLILLFIIFISLISAFSFSDLWNTITGRVVDNTNQINYADNPGCDIGLRNNGLDHYLIIPHSNGVNTIVGNSLMSWLWEDGRSSQWSKDDLIIESCDRASQITTNNPFRCNSSLISRQGIDYFYFDSGDNGKRDRGYILGKGDIRWFYHENGEVFSINFTDYICKNTLGGDSRPCGLNLQQKGFDYYIIGDFDNEFGNPENDLILGRGRDRYLYSSLTNSWTKTDIFDAWCSQGTSDINNPACAQEVRVNGTFDYYLIGDFDGQGKKDDTMVGYKQWRYIWRSSTQSWEKVNIFDAWCPAFSEVVSISVISSKQNYALGEVIQLR